MLALVWAQTLANEGRLVIIGNSYIILVEISVVFSDEIVHSRTIIQSVRPSRLNGAQLAITPLLSEIGARDLKKVKIPNAPIRRAARQPPREALVAIPVLRARNGYCLERVG